MRASTRGSIAFRWRPTALAGEAHDLVRLYEDGDGDGDTRLALLANGYESGFSTCWPPASRWVIDRFAAEWAHTKTGPNATRLRAAFAATRAAFRAVAPTLLAPDADFPEDTPDASLLVAAIDGTTIDIAWLGADRALVIGRDDRLVASNEPHTLRAQFRREHPDVPLDNVPHTTTKLLRCEDEPSYLQIDAQRGDRLVLTGGTFFRHHVALTTIAALPDAETIADLGYRDNEAYAAVAIVPL